jgi:V/A-type H+-transporting ATPase subunit D
LRRRLDVARRGVGLLDRKLRVLRTEQARLHALTIRTGAEWEARCRDAEDWLVRAALLGGQREIRLGTPSRPVRVAFDWTGVMGMRYPSTPDCQPGEPGPAEPVCGSAALVEAAAAYRAALRAGVAHAAATAAGRAVETEIAETSRRLRAIADRWIPRTEEALRTLTQRLEDTELADNVRLRMHRDSYGG